MKIAFTRSDATFDQAFGAARAAGCDKFVWQGKEYHTRRADDPVGEPPVITEIVESKEMD